MDRAVLDGITLEYEVSGTGEPVVFIHGALIADSFRPLLSEPALGNRYRLILYHRRGYMGSSRTQVPVDIPRQAADCRALLQHLGVERAHVVGHSLGGCIAIQLSMETPNIVQSLALLEPALMLGSTGPAYRDALVRSQQRFREGFAEQVADEFLQAHFGAEYRDSIERVLPGSFAQAVADAATSFELDMPGLLGWSFGEAEARRITRPVLAVLGSQSNALWPRFGETHRLLLEWLPQVQGFVLPGAAHGLQMQHPQGMAEAIADFWAHHPIRLA